MEQIVVVLFAATKGFLDKLPLSAIADFEQTVLNDVDKDFLKSIATKKTLDSDMEKHLESFLQNILDTMGS
jgi:F-type H+-transporting ATPase subunit alpha